MRGDQKNFRERNREMEKENDHYKTEKCIPKEQLLLDQSDEGLK